MYLYDLKEDSKLQISIRKNENTISFDCTVKMIVNGIVLIDALKQDDYVLQIPANIENSIIYINEDHRPVEWRDCTIKVIQYQGVTYHALISRRMGKIINRRNAFRMDMDIAGELKYTRHKDVIPVVVRDLSVTGFAFICVTDIEEKDFANVHLIFTDEQLHQIIDIVGNITRKEPYNGRILYGCKLTMANNNIANYIAEKQRFLARKNSTISKPAP